MQFFLVIVHVDMKGFGDWTRLRLLWPMSLHISGLVISSPWNGGLIFGSMKGLPPG